VPALISKVANTSPSCGWAHGTAGTLVMLLLSASPLRQSPGLRSNEETEPSSVIWPASLRFALPARTAQVTRATTTTNQKTESRMPPIAMPRPRWLRFLICASAMKPKIRPNRAKPMMPQMSETIAKPLRPPFGGWPGMADCCQGSCGGAPKPPPGADGGGAP
jgi:hypothetical protein